ncbi:multicopper oxidase domain-containing protein [Streptomyces clavuligerus]|nr:multicopper oxidase domain-containing protein [Streptomyces clavuligerus]ANW17260.1 copper oxidase [Streptomyces clavuligerus]AXU11803.1 copper oxidase [Streptomyces clavuligerus]EDY52937.1 SilA [Streptomyces clavuligerus]MBY6301642.1 multicopper oxidase domain-containing protein [Streptomyces clavuligerus]QCS04583.1 copper oxidase [Streptomyces clavuligerus]
MDRRSFGRRVLAGSAVAAGGAALSLSPAAAAQAGGGALAGGAALAANPPRTAPAGGRVRHMRLCAERLPDGRMGYGPEKGKATVPGPPIELTEGDTLHIAFENTMDVPVSLHVHGVDYDIANDGTRLTRSHVEPGETRTYTWRTHLPARRPDGTWRPGSAGYWHYHDHVVGTDHGTQGIRNGLYGPVVVRRAGDILPDRQFTIVFNDMTINNLPGHSGPDFRATVGDRVEIISITHGEYYHTFHLHGHRWADNRTGLLEGPGDVSRIIDNKICGPADSFGFQILAGENVGAGAWMYHCHVQSHSDMGMVGLLLVAKPDGTIPGYDPHHPPGHAAR